MNIENIISRARNLLTSPQNEWQSIASEATTVRDIYLNYLLLVAAVPAIAGFIKLSVIGISVPFLGTMRVGIGAGIGQMLFTYVLSLILIYVVALIIDFLAPYFDAQKNPLHAFKTAAFSYVIVMLAGVGQLIPWIGWLLVLAGSLYGIYLLYLALPTTMQCPKDKAVAYTAVSIVAAIVLGFLVALIVGGVAGVGGIASMSGSDSSSVNFDEDSPMGQLGAWSKKVEAASKELEQAQQSGDAEAQQEAMKKMMGAALGSGQLESLAPERLKEFLPETLANLPRQSMSVERNSAMGLQFPKAVASFGKTPSGRIELEIVDMGSGSGLMSLAGWAMVQRERETDTGFERVRKRDGRMSREVWDSQSLSGTSAVVLGERFLVSVSGVAEEFKDLQSALDEIDLDGLEKLRDEGVNKS